MEVCCQGYMVYCHSARCPAAPIGWGERLVQSTKHCLRKVIGQVRFSWDELRTAVVEAEAVIYCPLTYIILKSHSLHLTCSLHGHRILNSGCGKGIGRCSHSLHLTCSLHGHRILNSGCGKGIGRCSTVAWRPLPTTLVRSGTRSKTARKMQLVYKQIHALLVTLF
jgi:hypothetical protein